MYKGLIKRPPSVYILISLLLHSQEILVYILIRPFLLYSRNIFANTDGLRWHPIQLPLMNTLHNLNISPGVNSSNTSRPCSIQNSMIGFQLIDRC
jgi:hypothetical protein